MSFPEQMRFDCKHIRKTGKYSLEKLNVQQRRMLERKLRAYEHCTVGSFRRSNGANPNVVNFSAWKNAPSVQQQRQVRQEISVDIPYPGPVWRFRISGKMRVLGYWDENIFFVVWVDAKHEMGG